MDLDNKDTTSIINANRALDAMVIFISGFDDSFDLTDDDIATMAVINDCLLQEFGDEYFDSGLKPYDFVKGLLDKSNEIIRG